MHHGRSEQAQPGMVVFIIVPKSVTAVIQKVVKVGGTSPKAIKIVGVTV
jgi:hypothetical protein